MNLRIKKSILLILIIECSFSFSTKAQLASSRPMTAFYNKKINDKLAESTAGKSKPKSQNWPSNDPDINKMAKSKIKNPEIARHESSPISKKETKRKLPSNSIDLRQKGRSLRKSK